MATLRDSIGVNTSTGQADLLQEQSIANGMGDLRRGWASGRIGNEMNPLRVDALKAQIAGDTAGEKTLRDQVGALEQRQQMYAPRVGRVEDIKGVGDGLDWAAGQVGQGAASMVDPIAVSGGLGLVGRIASAVPNPVAKAVGAAAQLGSLGVPYLMGQRQLAGEYLGEAGRDKALMERTSPQALRDSSETYGYGAAALDTVLPAYLGRQLTGAGLRKGISSMSPLAKTGLGMATEGGTETLQSMGSQYARGQLNPERDTSGDFMENVNSFAGGAIGSGPLTAAGAFADTGYRRVGDTGQRVGEAAQRVVGAAGDTVDLLNNSGPVQQAREAGSKLFGRARGTVTDLMSNEDGEVSSAALLDNLRAATQGAVSKVKTSSEERDILMQTGVDANADPAEIQRWLADNDPKRTQLVAEKLNAMQDDEKAQSILDRAINGTPDEQQAAVNEGAAYLSSQSLVGRATERGEALGRLLTKGGEIAGRGAAGAAKGVLGFGKAVINGMSDGMSKKNAQVASTDETFQDFRDRLYGVEGKQAAGQALAQGASYNKALEFGQRADLAGAYAADMAQRTWRGRPLAVTQSRLARNLAYTLADMFNQFDTGTAARAPRTGGLGPKEAKLNRLALDAFGAFKENTPEVIERLGSILGPQAQEAVAYLQQETQQLMRPNGEARVAAQRDALGRQAVELVSVAAKKNLLDLGVNLDTEDGREELLKIHERYADGMTKIPGVRKVMDERFGADSVSRILELLNGEPEKTSGLGTADERTMTGSEQSQEANLDDPDADETTAFDQRMNEKLMVKGSGPKIYAYGNGAGLRSSDERRDPFAALNTPGADGVVQRPALFDGEQKLSINAFNAFAAAATKGMKPKDRAEWMEDPANRLMTTKKIFDLRARLVTDPEYPDHDNYRVETKSAHQVMKDNNMQPGKVLQLYRDYMRMDAADETLSVGQRKYATQQAATAHRMILDAITKQDADKKLVKFEFADNAERRSELTAAAKEYFEQRQVVTAEQISNRDPEKIGATEVLDLIKDGRSKLDRVRLNNSDMIDADKAVATSEANILYFTGKDEKGKKATLPIQAGRLVNLVRQRQGENRQMDVDENGKKFSNKSKDDEYLADVLMGIGMLVDSGQVTGMPYMLDRFGKATSFGKAVPESLMLATQTYGSKKFGDAKRQENQSVDVATVDPKKRAIAQADVEDAKRKLVEVQANANSTEEELMTARNEVGFAMRSLDKFEATGGQKVDIDLNRNADYFEADDRVERELVESPFTVNKRQSGKNDTSTAANAKDAGGALVTRGAIDRDINNPSSRGTSTSIRVDVSGQRAVEPKFDGDFAGPEWGPKSTPLDFSRGQDPKVVDDETTEVLRRTKTSGKSAYTNDIGPEPKGKAVDMAPRRAAEIGAAYMRSEAEAMAMIERRFRMAAAPAYSSDENAVVGGPHYIAPVAVFVGAKNLAGMDLGIKEAKQMTVLQGRVAQVLQGEGVSKTERVKMARLMSTDPAKVTAMNVDAMLAKVVARAGLKEAAAQDTQSAPEVANAGLPKGQQTLSGGVKLTVTGPHTSKDQAKSDRASKFIGRGSRASSTATYAADWGDRANTGSYTADDVVFVSAEGVRNGRLDPDKVEIGKAIAAGATILTDSVDSGRLRKHNIGERQVARLLTDSGYAETGPGTWTAPVRKLNAQGGVDPALRKLLADASNALANRGEALRILNSLSEDDRNTLQNDILSAPDRKTLLPKSMEYDFRQWLNDSYGPVERETAMAWENKSETETQYLEELVDPDNGYGPLDRLMAAAILGRKLNATASNQQDGPSHVSSQAERDEASAYLLKILGPKISVAFKDITGYSGEFIDARNAIEISTMAAAGTMSTAYHEAMHVFFRDFVKGNPKMQAVFESLVNDDRHLAKLEALLTGYPAAQAQLKGGGSGEERLAYTYQFWAAGLLQVDAKAKTWLQKVGKFFRHVLGMARDSEKALELFTAFHEGRMAEPSAAGEVISKALDKGKLTLAARRKFDALIQGVAALTVPSGEILAQSLSPEARKLATKFFTNPGDSKVGGDQEGYMNARRRVATKYSNTFAQTVNDMSDSDQASVQKYLQSRTELADIPLALHRDAVKSVRALLNRFHEHMVEAGLEIGYDADNYYPTMWSMDALLNKKDAFTQMLVSKFSAQMDAITGSPEDAAERIWLALVNKNGVQEHLPAQREDGVLAPFFASGENRTLSWLKGPDVEPFLQKNLIGTMTGYFHQGARAAEYQRRFGKDGVELEKSLNTINQELTAASKEKMKRGELKDDKARGQWLSRQMRDVSQAVGAMEGTLGKDVSPAMRKFSSWMAVYQNIRLLPMSLFSSFVDPLGLVARGATMPEAYDAFLSGMQKVVQAWGDVFRDMPPERKKSQWESLAEHVGAVDAALFSHHVSDEYASAYMSPGAKKINDKMFVLNGMEAWNRGMRVAATKSAVRFIERHAALPDKNHSKRWLQELGLNPATVPLDSEGNLITSRHELAAAKGIDLTQATKEIADVHYAINRWVEGAVLTPNAAQRPAWASDPNYSMFFHLKQFSYSFHQTILKRAVGELKYGNMAPMGAFLWYIPTMIAADVTKGLIQGGGELPAYMKGYDLGDWLMHGYQRAGLSGVGTIGLDAAADVASLGGPAVEQIIDAARDPLGRIALNSLPLHALFAQALK